LYPDWKLHHENHSLTARFACLPDAKPSKLLFPNRGLFATLAPTSPHLKIYK